MPRYLYKGRNEMGAVKTGSIDAVDDGSARKILGQRGIEVSHLEEFGPAEGDELIAEAETTMPVHGGAGRDEGIAFDSDSGGAPPRKKGNPLIKFLLFLIIVGGLAAGGWYAYTNNLIPGYGPGGGQTTPAPPGTEAPPPPGATQ